MRVMDRLEGDYRITWDPDSADEVAAAKASFDALLGTKRYMAFNLAKPGDRGEQIREFDPTAGTLILTPPLAGG